MKTKLAGYLAHKQYVKEDSEDGGQDGQ